MSEVREILKKLIKNIPSNMTSAEPISWWVNVGLIPSSLGSGEDAKDCNPGEEALLYSKEPLRSSGGNIRP